MRIDDLHKAEQARLDRVIIAAAVAAMAGPRASVLHVRAIPGHAKGAWMREGRLALQAAHRTAAPLARLVPGPERSEG